MPYSDFKGLRDYIHHKERESEYNARVQDTERHPAQGRTWGEILSNQRGAHGLYEQAKNETE